MPKAVEYILSIYDTIPTLDEALQMSIIEVIRLDCMTDSTHRVSELSFVSTAAYGMSLTMNLIVTVHSMHI
jgi:hypothetical protein